MQNTEQFAQTIAQSLLGVEADHPARPLIAMRGIRKSYYIGQPNELEILHGIDLTVYPGEFVAIVGESGSGKSTLMNIIGVLDKPTAGEYVLDGVNIHEADDNDLAAIRNRKIGFVFQTYNLVNEPALILADEPTGALDSQTSRVVMDLFHEMHEKYHKTIVLITHNPALAEECQRVLTLRDGLIVGERKGTGERAAL